MSSKPKTKHNTNCCVYGCHSRKMVDRSIHFHCFPDKNSGILVKIVNALGEEEKIDKRKAWEKVLLMGKPVTKYLRVCSKHFVNEDYCARGVPMKQPKLKRFAVPSQNLPKKRCHSKDDQQKGLSKLHGQRLFKRQKTKEQNFSAFSDVVLCESEVINVEENKEQIPRTEKDLTEDEKVVIQNLLSLGNSQSHVSVTKEAKNGDIFSTLASTIKLENCLNSLTGINSFELLDSLIKLVTVMYPDKKIS